MLELMGHVDEKVEPGLVELLDEMAQDLVANLASFGCSMARRCDDPMLEPHHMALHALRGWSLPVPGFTGKPLERPEVAAGLDPSSDTARLAVARQLRGESALEARQLGSTAPGGQ